MAMTGGTVNFSHQRFCTDNVNATGRLDYGSSFCMPWVYGVRGIHQHCRGLHRRWKERSALASDTLSDVSKFFARELHDIAMGFKLMRK